MSEASTSNLSFIDAAIKSLSPRCREVIIGRFFRERSDRELAIECGLTAERLRQFEAATLNELVYLFGDKARGYTNKLRDELIDSRGIVHINHAETLTCEDDFGKILLALHIAGQTKARWWRDEFLVINSADEQESLFDELKQALIDLNELQVDLDDAVDAAGEIGLIFDYVATERMLNLVFDLQVRNRCFISPWFSPPDNSEPITEIGEPDQKLLESLATILALHDGPMKLRQIYKILKDTGHSKDTISAHLNNAPFALFLERGRYLHRSATGLSSEATETLMDNVDSLLHADDTPMGSPAVLEFLASNSFNQPASQLADHPDGPRILWALARRAPDLIVGTGLLIAHSTNDSAHLFFHLITLDAIDDLGLARTYEIIIWLRDNLAVTISRSILDSILVELRVDERVYKLPNLAYCLKTEDPTELIDYFSERPQLLREAVVDIDPGTLPKTIRRALVDFYKFHDPDAELVARLETM